MRAVLRASQTRPGLAWLQVMYHVFRFRHVQCVTQGFPRPPKIAHSSEGWCVECFKISGDRVPKVPKDLKRQPALGGQMERPAASFFVLPKDVFHLHVPKCPSFTGSLMQLVVSGCCLLSPNHKNGWNAREQTVKGTRAPCTGMLACFWVRFKTAVNSLSVQTLYEKIHAASR